MKNIESVYPLSPMQQGMLFHSLDGGRSLDYFRRISCVLEGQLDPRAFRSAWEQAIKRHAVLRTSFVWKGIPEPVQVIHREVVFPWNELDWRALPSAEQRGQFEAFLEHDQEQSFDLSHPPLLRCTLIRISETSWRFVWTLHHIVLDGWSLPLLLKDVFAFYEATLGKGIPQLSPLRNYRDFIVWLKQQDTARAEAFWRDYLQGFAVRPPLLVERSLPGEQPFAYGKHSLVFSADETLALQRSAGKMKVTLNTLVEGAWAVLLNRYSGEQDIVFGTTVSGRSQTLPGIESMLGLFINTLPFRMRVEPHESVSALLERLQLLQANLREYESSSLRDVQKWSEIPRGQPLFESILVFENYPDHDSFWKQDGAIRIRDVDSFERTSYPLTLLVSSGKELRLSLLYDTRRFEGCTVERALDHLKQVLLDMQNDKQVHSLSLLGAAERELVTRKWNDSAADYPGIPVYRLIEKRASRFPDRVAVVFEGRPLTYAQLNCSANGLAEYLRRRGVGRGTLVGICVERSLEMVVGLLGILKAGAAYVPFDPGYPKERLAFMVADAEAPLILTQESLVRALPETGTPLVCLDRDWSAIAACEGENSTAGASLEDLAYVIYTSGSTGQPKGAMNTHRGLCNRLWWMQRAYQLKSDDRVLQKTPFSFDVSVWEFFWPLLAGAALVVARPGGHRDPSYLIETIRTEQITTLHFVPSMLRAFIEEPGVEQCLSLRRVICSGEALPHDLEEQFFARLGAELHNLYGPSEASIDVTHWKCVRDGRETHVPIGRPIANTQIYILDRTMNPVPIAVVGELYIGGVGVGKGYWNRPELTKEKFLPDPFVSDPAARLYKTGDLARYRPDGAIEYLGRLDQQVKIRGFRIELGEIEATLATHPAIRECAVVASEDHPGEKRLVAYLTLQKDLQAKISDLRTYLGQKLPDYAVPSLFVVLESMPLAPNGKLDRRALPPLESSRLELGTSYVPPRTPVEQKLAEIWGQVLKQDRVGIYDNFFELGGDSILSIQITSRANEAGLRLSARDLFKHSTIADLATIVNTAAVVEAEQGVVRGSFPPTPIQSWFLEQDLEDPQHWNQGLFLRTRRAIDREALRRALNSLIEHHDALRLRVVRHGAQYSVTNDAAEEILPFSFFDFSSLSRAEQESSLRERAEELQASLDLERGPILRVAWFDLGADRQGRLLFLVHHMAIDGVSWRILLEDLARAYEQARHEAVIQLPLKTTSFLDWACRLNEYAKTSEAEADYWLGLAWDQAKPVPTDFSRGPNSEASARTITVALDEKETQLLLKQVPEALHTQINDTLLTALAHACARQSEEAVIPIALEGHGREDVVAGVDLSRTVGWFTTLFPVLVRVRTSANLLDELKSVKEQLRKVPNRGIGYGVLRYLGNEVTRNKFEKLPQPTLAFNYLGQFDQVLVGDGMFSLAPESLGGFHSPRGNRSYLLEVNASVVEGRLQVSWTYSENLHRRNTVEELSREFLSKVRAVIELSDETTHGAYTPSDFPLAELDQATLDQLTLGEKIEDLYPLSPMQEGMLFHSLAAPESGLYLEQLTCRIEGQLDVQAFQRAWQEVLSDHPALRTGFEWQKTQKPLQIVHRCAKIPFTYTDWSKIPGTEQRARLDDFLQEDRCQGFEFRRVPLMRFAAMRFGAECHQFVWTWSHLLLDGWCLPLVLKEAFSNYAQISAGKNLSPRLGQRARYREYIAWLHGQDLQTAEAFWRQSLKGFLNPPQIGTDRSAGEAPSDADHAEQHTRLSPELTAQLKAFARRNQLTLNTLIQGAWAFLLSRLSGEADVVFGATTSGRPAELPGIESVVGLFINTLPMRILVNDDEPLATWLARIQVQQTTSQQYAYTPLVQIRSWAELPQHLPLFQTLIAFENYPLDNVQGGRDMLKIRDVHIKERTNYPLNVTISPGDTLAFRITYDRRSFSAEEIQLLLGQLGEVLRTMAAEPHGRVGGLRLLTAQERIKLVEEWNRTEREYPRERGVAELVEAQAKSHPDRVAVASSEVQSSYAELNARANQLARYLKQRGVGPEVLVCVCMQRSVEMVVGLLAVLKAGGAYVPLDSGYPVERLAFMLEDAGASVLLTQQKLLPKLPFSTLEVICVDKEGDEIAGQSKEDLQPEVKSDNLAYVIYTSGSTGKPKGVAIEQSGLLNLIHWHQLVYDVNEEDRATLLAAQAFDASVWELWPYLTAGASIHIPDEEVRSSPQALLEWLAEEGITLTFLATPLAEAVLEEELPRNLRLKALLTGGDRLHGAPQKELPFRLMNHYGPTENTVVATYCEVRPYEKGVPPIGRPITNTQVYVLDERGEPVAVGMTGELYIGGDGVARGYWNRPELTAERFVEDRFHSEAGRTLYRTGDLVRYRADGNLEFLGRADQQVKIRGFRIEPGEIEAVLQKHPEVHQAVVLVREDTPGEKRLVAYVVRQKDETQASELRQWMKHKLPDYMVPGAFVFLNSLPISSNGKIDRRALPPATESEPASEYVPPRSTTERELCTIWEQVLKKRQLGIHDNFFDLGGHSLLAMRVTARCSDLFHVALPLVSIFENPTVEQFAALVENVRGQAQHDVKPAIVARSREMFRARGAGQ